MKIFLAALFSVFLPCLTQAATNQIVVASWNVENLFDTEDDPDNKHDNGYTPGGWMYWSERRYQLKLEHLSDVIASIRPQILCLSEVENRRVLEDLVQTLKVRYQVELPYITHRDGTDLRGIDVAILSSRPPVRTKWLRPLFGQRDVAVAEFEWEGKNLTVLANHWKSKLGKKEESLAIRKKCALTVRNYLETRLQQDPQAAIIVAGDFNDGPESLVMEQVAGFARTEKNLMATTDGYAMMNITATVPEKERMSYYYAAGDDWSAIDQIIVSRGVWTGTSPWSFLRGSYRVVRYPAHLWMNDTPMPFRRIKRKRVGDVYVTGYSDHFPICISLFFVR